MELLVGLLRLLAGRLEPCLIVVELGCVGGTFFVDAGHMRGHLIERPLHLARFPVHTKHTVSRISRQM